MAFLKAACHSRIRAIASMPAVTKSLEKPVAGAAGAAASAGPSGKVKTIWFPLKLMGLLVRRGEAFRAQTGGGPKSGTTAVTPAAATMGGEPLCSAGRD